MQSLAFFGAFFLEHNFFLAFPVAASFWGDSTLQNRSLKQSRYGNGQRHFENQQVSKGLKTPRIIFHQMIPSNDSISLLNFVW